MFKKALSSTLLLMLSQLNLSAIDTKFSGFATLGGAISDQDYTYEKYIDNKGTLRSDTLAGLQLDIYFSEKWSATIQGKISQSLKNDDDFDPILTWGFVSYRPTNDWLIRAGKVRVPFYLNSQNKDVGITYDFARLPIDVYTLSPYDNGLGGIVTKSFELDNGTLSVDAFLLRMELDTRNYIPTVGAVFSNTSLNIRGISLSYETDEYNRFRGGFYNTELQGYDINIMTLGADYTLGNDYKLMGEYTMIDILDYGDSPDSQSAYISLLKQIDNWTPYLTYGLSLPNDTGQRTYTIGTSYSITPLQKIKAELMHVNVGSNPSSLIDMTSLTQSYANEKLNLFSFSYNIAF